MLGPKDRLGKIANDLWKSDLSPSISVNIPQSLYHEFILRKQDDVNVSEMIAEQAYYFLERTLGDEDIWSYTHAEEAADESQWKVREEFGPAHEGYYWKKVFLPNGTKIKMTYKGKIYYAEVKYKKILHEGREHSPSQLVNYITNSSRNAWRDLYLMFPGRDEWEWAYSVRNALDNSNSGE